MAMRWLYPFRKSNTSYESKICESRILENEGCRTLELNTIYLPVWS